MKPIDRQAALARTIAFFDAHDAALDVNDPDVQAEKRQRAFDLFMGLMVEWGGDLTGERLASALITREPFAPGSAYGALAEAAARKPVAPALEDDGSRGCRPSTSRARPLHS